MSLRTLIIGCGYVGLPLALKLKEKGNAVSVWVHSSASAESLAVHGFQRIITGSVGEQKGWEDVREKFDLVIHGASSGRGGPDAYREVFLRGVEWINARQPEARRFFVSSTSVYGQAEGEKVTEESPAEPAAETGKILREAEMAAIEGGAVVVRSSGIYGPERGVLWEKFRRGEAVIEGDGQRWINQIHRDDLVSALLHLVEKGEQDQIYNATDDAPVTQLEFYSWCAEFLKKPMPPHGPINTQRKRGLTNKRVSNARLRATGWSLRYPSFREGLSSLV